MNSALLSTGRGVAINKAHGILWKQRRQEGPGGGPGGWSAGEVLETGTAQGPRSHPSVEEMELFLPNLNWEEK